MGNRMTIEEAIKHCEEVAEKHEQIAFEAELQEEYGKITPCKEYASEHRQLAEWLKELQERRKQPEIIYCKDCKHYHTDVWGGELGIGGMYGNIIVAHNACDRWTKGMNCVEPEGFCFLAERRTDEQPI